MSYIDELAPDKIGLPALRAGEISFAAFVHKQSYLTRSKAYVNFAAEEYYGKSILEGIGQTLRKYYVLLNTNQRIQLRTIFRDSAMTEFAFLEEVKREIRQDDNSSVLRLPDVEDLKYQYHTRPEGKYKDPLDYMDQVWGKYIESGILFQRNLRHLDPKLIPAVRAYCQRMAIAHPERAHEYVANERLPPGNRQRTPNPEDTVEGTAENMIARERARERERRARARSEKISNKPMP